MTAEVDAVTVRPRSGPSREDRAGMVIVPMVIAQGAIAPPQPVGSDSASLA
jgi:hypothetical protein